HRQGSVAHLSRSTGGIALDPPLIWFNGHVIPWQEARVHVWSEVAIRGASVFEGIRAYWHAGSENWYALALDEHLARLRNSAKIMRYPAQVEFEKLREGMGALLRGLAYREHAYLRPTIYLDESHGGGVGASDVPVRSYIVAFPAPRQAGAFAGIRCVVS